MVQKKKKFIDKKKAVTFQLVHRSQKDPLVTDDSAPKRVLQPILKGERKDELEKYGIYYDDDYDYMQHLKPRSGGTEAGGSSSGATLLPACPPPIRLTSKETRVALPSSVFASHVEDSVGLLNKAAPSRGLDLSLDPEVVAALDSDYDFSDSENEFEDDFILQLNAPNPRGSGSEMESDAGSDGEGRMGSDDEVGGEAGESDMEWGEGEEWETKSRFTEYSMTSSVMRRNDQLRHLDDCFQQMYAGYDETELGALETEEIEGELELGSDYLLQMAQEFDSARRPEKLEGAAGQDPMHLRDEEGSDSECSLVEVPATKENWDCQSVLSTYSNIYNHPALIDTPSHSQTKIKINQKTGIAETRSRLTARALAALGGDVEKGPASLASAVAALSVRLPGETPDQRKARKQAFRNHKQERRKEKKLNTEAFKQEKNRLEMARASLPRNLVKIA